MAKTKTTIPALKKRQTDNTRKSCCVGMDGRSLARKVAHQWAHSRTPFSVGYLAQVGHASIEDAAEICRMNPSELQPVHDDDDPALRTYMGTLAKL